MSGDDGYEAWLRANPAPDLQGGSSPAGAVTTRFPPRPGASTTAPWRSGRSAGATVWPGLHLRKFGMWTAQIRRRSASAACRASIGGHATGARFGAVRRIATRGRITPTAFRERPSEETAMTDTTVVLVVERRR